MKAVYEIYRKYLAKFSGYYAKEGVHDFALQPDKSVHIVKQIHDKIPAVLIVSREFYQEKITTYPIDNDTELAKLLDLEFSGTNSAFKIIQKDNGQTKVNTWVFNEEVPTARLLIPESFLLSSLLETNQVAVCQKAESKLFISRFFDGTISSLSSRQITNVNLFSLSAEINASDVAEISTEQYFVKIIDALSHISPHKFSPFFTKIQKSQWFDIIKFSAIPMVGIFSVYLLLSSSWLTWRNWQLENQLAEQNQGVIEALAVQTRYDDASETLMNLEHFLSNQQAKSLLWLVLAKLLNEEESETRITAIRFNDERFVILGETAKATDLLTSLLAMSEIKDPKFDFPVRKGKKSESFNISFLIDNKVTSDDEKL